MNIERRLERYIKNDSERWHAVHQRITGMEMVAAALVDGIRSSDPRAVTETIRSLRSAETALKEQGAAPATISAITTVLNAITAPVPTSAVREIE